MGKNIRSFIISVLLISGSTGSAAAAELYWYLAASMANPGQELVEIFNRSGASFTVILITGGSGQLLSKITAAGKADLYTPAGLYYVEKAKELNLLKSHIKLIIQTPVFALSARGQQKIHNWSDLMAPGIRIGLGNQATMALGRSYQKISNKMEPGPAAAVRRNMVVETMNVSQIINYLKTGVIDAGIAFASTAGANKLSYIEIPPGYNNPETAPLITLTSETNPENTRLFSQFIENHLAVFEKHGFRPVSRDNR